ncbi:methionyl-tRNA formyltransferase [Liquorilactobacillus satsumensis]|uniref:methionyl-tRNA formyltransferase n=1 Tax=Liquorilactobacillus satsumensis TaxID=259059 RepID=UPI0021C3D93E|nr:methionyl-tRNA formyltransferase [Liquorilactobacillus satsumensis]MCP9311838.1 methionyl-tRNA formyltransferase [Liquorilactobacillus satsumensis]MCP9358011.1 methionyl-tRNA formyltransferase [Liquorilactobacillus satsumensis]MCP9358971.1 methionyl-tRNA formyltransferase [Liquorilactobacillus satsumensis]MCP9371828.1 methionyl-tRNA formyltransferase [Liquorilactobacillus satsumensis]
MTSVVFMGTPQFAATILEGLVEADYDIKAVVTQPDRLTGRKRVLTHPPVKAVALKHGIRVLQPQKISGSPEMAAVIELAPDLIITAAFGQFLPDALIAAAKVGAVNVHGSLLPKYRGGAPVQYAIMNGDSLTGVTLIYMVKKMDAGAMLAQAKLPIGATDDTGTIFAKMSVLGRTLLLETLPKLLQGEIEAVPQAEDQVTFSPVIRPEQETLSLQQTAVELDWKIRALRPQPGAYFKQFLGKRTKLWQIKPLTEKTTLAAGFVVEVDKKHLKVAAAKGTVYQLEVLQPAGKPKMNISAYLNGQGQGIKAGQRIITDE